MIGPKSYFSKKSKMEREKVIADRIERKSDRISQEFFQLKFYESFRITRSIWLIWVVLMASFWWVISLKWKLLFEELANGSENFRAATFQGNIWMTHNLWVIISGSWRTVSTDGAREFKYKSFGCWYETRCPRWNKKNYKNCKFRIKYSSWIIIYES